jgi:hypothetical protein
MNYYCNYCSVKSGYLGVLATGNVTGCLQLTAYTKHTSGNAKSEVNGVFYLSGDVTYERRMRQIAHSGFVGVPLGSPRVAFLRYVMPIGKIETFGSYSGDSMLSMAVLIDFPWNFHGFPCTGLPTTSGHCLGCGISIF